MKTYRIILAACAALIIAALARGQSPVDQAIAATKQGDLASAETLLLPLVTAEKPDPAAVYRLGIVRLQQKRAKDAVELAEQATKLDPTKPEYFSQLGMALSVQMKEVGFMQMAMLSGKMKKAFQKSIELDPRHLTGLIGLTRYYANAPEMVGGSLTKARELAGRVHQIDPFLGELELGRIAEKDEDYAEALARFDAASRLKPANAMAHTLAGQALVKLERKTEARGRFEAALKAVPNFEPAKKALAELDAAP